MLLSKTQTAVSFSLLLLSSVAQADLIGYWDFDNTIDGVVYDQLGLHNGTTDATSTDGILGDALYFDGSQMAEIAYSGLPLTDMTISFWVLADPNVDMGYFSIQNDDGKSNDRHLGTSNGEGYARVWTEDSVRAYAFTDAETQTLQEWTQPLTYDDDDAWHQWTFTIESGIGQSMYIDGDLVGTKDDIDASGFDWSTYIRVGMNNDNGYTVGAIDELAIYDSALTSEEVMDLNLAYLADVPISAIGYLSLAG
jgi:hypothetical protein